MIHDVTDKLLEEITHTYGEDAKRLRRAKGATHRPLSPGQREVVRVLRDPRNDNSMGFISKPLLYSKFWSGKPKRFQDDVIRLLKSGKLLVIEVAEKPEPGTFAHRDSPYGEKFYNLEINPESGL